METDVTEVEIAIIGAGLSGLGAAIELRREGREDFVVLERADALGGTWRDNRYPGCACDIPSVLYSYAGEPNHDWSRAYAPQPEIWAYMREVARRHDVERFMRFGHELQSARFDEQHDRWELETSRGRLTANVLVSAAGALADPAIPELPGLETFAGTAFHSAQWRSDHPLEGRRVAVVGTGASAIQFVPEIQPAVAQLTLFQRTPPWVLPRGNPTVPAAWRRAFARLPLLQRFTRATAFSLMESVHVGFRHPLLMRAAARIGRAAIAREVADPDLRARLTPSYSPGCKRLLQSDRWYPALVAPNVEVVSGAVREVVPDGVIDAAGVHHAVDTLIFGTGFHVTDTPIAQRIFGRGGARLTDTWAGSAKAHLGMSVPGFPNMFFLLGPNTGLGHNSVLLMIEAQIAQLRAVLSHRTRLGAATIEPTRAAYEGFVAEVDREMRGSVWSAGGCQSWYVDATGRNSTLWPGSVRAYQRRLARFEPADWVAAPPRPAPTAPELTPALG